MSNVREVIETSLRGIDTFLNKGVPGRAFPHFLVVLHLDPTKKQELEDKFANTLCEWGKQLEAQERYNDLYTCYKHGLEHYPESPVICNNLAAHLFRLKHYKEADSYFKLALHFDENYLPAWRNLQNVKNVLVERWHFVMLNDAKRNESFRRAISKKIKEGYDNVLDIGTGTGLLSLYAKAEGAKSVYACDCSETMINIAQNVFDSNLPPGSITLLPKMSIDIKLNIDIHKKFSLVVSEIADAGLFGERILQTLIHAWDNLLIPNGSFLPQKAKLYCAVVECRKIASRSFLLSKERRRPLPNLQELMPIKSIYDTENISKIEHVFLSKPQLVFDVNFNNVNDIKSHLKGEKDKVMTINLTQTGYVDAIVSWFDLYVDDENVISTAPESEGCWDQAIFPNTHCSYKKTGECLNIEAHCKNGFLKFKIEESNGYEVTEMLLRAANCVHLNKCLYKVVSGLRSEKRIENVLELSEFPYAGVLFTENDINVDCRNTFDWKKIFGSYTKLKPISWPDEMQESKYDIIVADIFNETGEIDEDTVRLLPLIRKCLRPEGLILPRLINVMCQLISSKQLENEYAINDNNTKFTVADHLNPYQVTTRIDLSIKELDHKKCSDVFTVGPLEVLYLDNDANTIFTKEVIITETGSVNGVAYWFEADYNYAKYDTRSEFYVNQVVEILEGYETIEGDIFNLRILHNNGILKFDKL